MAQSQHQGGFSETAYCPYFQATLELIGRRWTGAILRPLFAGEARFSELARVVPDLSHRLLTERLSELQEAGIVERDTDRGAPAYRLTERGRDLESVFTEIEAWNVRWVEQPDAVHYSPDSEPPRV